jgi:hypothetical protein
MSALQKHIDAMYTKFPQPADSQHRIHGAISLLADMWMQAAAENRPVDL